MKTPKKISLAFKALRELGPRQLGFYGFYKLGLKMGYYRIMTGDRRQKTEKPGLPPLVIGHILDLPEPDEILRIIGTDGLSLLVAEADEIVDGHFRIFGGSPVPIILTPPNNLCHWTETNTENFGDIKFVWEPARFGWVFTLGRAYHLTKDERYPAAFWVKFEQFQAANPVNLGPNWASAQEVALRLIAFVFASQIFADSVHSLVTRTSHLANAIADHAIRIPPTLIYARAQNNNHLLSEAAGLITAGLALPDHPQSKKWIRLGWKWFNRGLESQIAADGSYMQQSTNYHRLILQLALWVHAIVRLSESANQQPPNPLTPNPLTPNLLTPISLPPNLQLATRWLLTLVDLETGRVPNLGPNDGAYILPLTVQPFHDYRPVLQAASRAFLDKPAFEGGSWDEMILWFCSDQSSVNYSRPLDTENRSRNTSPSTLRAPRSWAYLRTAHFSDRPGHADQLHLDLWWRGINVAQDAGTYLYNADPPWDNALMHTAVHNTLLIDGKEQMTRAGRFLYLDKAQAECFARQFADDGSWEKVIARHDGYAKVGIVHNRSVTVHQDDHWVVEDFLLPVMDTTQNKIHTVRLHWLLPDWPYEVHDSTPEIRIQSPFGWVTIQIQAKRTELAAWNVQLVRAGEIVFGSGEISPTWGWVSPTYGEKQPALSWALEVSDSLPMSLKTTWTFPNG